MLSRIFWFLNDCKAVELLSFCLLTQRVLYAQEFQGELWGISDFSLDIVESHGFYKYCGIPCFKKKKNE